MNPLTSDALNLIFLEARTHHGWQDKTVSEDLLRRIYNIARMGPTSANCQPGRIVFVISQDGKQRLAPALDSGNLDKTMQAPVTAIFAYDMQFHDHFYKTFPHTDARSWFHGNEPLIEETAFRNGTLQAAYFMIAARALGLNCGPMSGFDQDKVNREFFRDGRYRANFLCNLGYGTDENLFGRTPRLDFEETCELV